MKVVGIDGKFYSLNPHNESHPRVKPSSYHTNAKKLLGEMFPYDNIYEEVILPGTGKSCLVADFFIPSRSIIVEVQGQQHFEKTFFHKTKLEFYKGGFRDKVKKEWCEINSITLIELPYTETVDEWRTRVNSSK